jgi:hypothetical protein
MGLVLDPGGAEGAGAPEEKIAITPAMVEAGLDELAFWALDDSHVSAACISEVYAAMERARLEGLRKRTRLPGRSKRSRVRCP